MKIKKSFMAFVGMIGLLASLASCSDWGQMDPAAGTDVYPTREKLSTLNFNESTSLDELEYVQSYSATTAEVVYDDFLYSQVLHLGGGTATLKSPFTGVKLQKGAGFTFWLQTPEGAADAPVLSVGGAELKLKGAPAGSTEVTTDGEWHFVAFQVWANNFQLYVDGEAVGTTAAENAAIIEAIDKSETITLSATDDIFVDDITFIRNQMNEKDYARPEIKKGDVKVPDPVYFNNFDNGAGDCTIVGGGSFRSDDTPGFNKVFQNITGGMRKNYLLLPEDALSHSAQTQKMTIGVWVNASEAGASDSYMWAPLFMAYASAPNPTNTFPMFACQYRGVLQVNNNGWTDYTDAQNVEGVNKLYHAATDWLVDKQWHYYTAVFNGENAKVYLDGVLANEWQMDGANNTQMGLFTNGADLKYICLGGNQAWDWADNDPGFAFDDIAIYDDALNAGQIEKIMTDKANGGGTVVLPVPVYYNDFTKNTAEIVGAGSIATDADSHFGAYFQNKAGAKSTNYLLLPSDALSHSAGTNEMTIAFWVNAANAGETNDYTYSPFFTAYSAAPSAANGMPMFALQSRGNVQINNNGWCDFTSANNVNGKNNIYHSNAWEAGDAAFNFVNNWLEDKAWHYYTITFTPTDVIQYMDGEITNQWKLDGSDGQIVSGLFTNGADYTHICVGGAQAWDWGDPDGGFGFDDIAIYDKVLSVTDIKNIIAVKSGAATAGPTPYYKNTFDALNGAEIVGAGSIADDPVHGKVFQNKAGAKSTNYLLLPSDVLAHSADSKQLSISFWVNAANAGETNDYTYSPFFTAYSAAPSAANGMPMFALQSRGNVQINNNGWCDFTSANNVNGKNNIYHSNAWEAGDAAFNFVNNWLEDKAWHLYVITFTETDVIQYMDGEITNQWKLDGKTEGQIVSGLFTNGGDYTHICLGGAQAWDWGDPDGGFAFDDVQFFDFALSVSDIQALLSQY